MAETINLEPNWDSVRAYLRNMYLTEPDNAKRIAKHMGSEAPDFSDLIPETLYSEISVKFKYREELSEVDLERLYQIFEDGAIETVLLAACSKVLREAKKVCPTIDVEVQ